MLTHDLLHAAGENVTENGIRANLSADEDFVAYLDVM